MPPRLITGAILVFWLGMTGWLLQREVVPAWLADTPPSYLPDFTEELSTPVVSWTIFRDGERAGSANSRIVRVGRGYEFRSIYNFNEKVAFLEQVDTHDRLTDEGHLEAFRHKFVLAKVGTFEMKGKVLEGKLQPQIFVNGVEAKMFDLGSIDMSRQEGDAVNTLSLINRLRNLRENQTWKVPSLDFTSSVQKLGGGDLLNMFAVRPMLATAKIGALAWDGKEVPCYKIEYREPGKDVAALTWARRMDGLVLRQELSLFGINMVFERMAK